MTDKVKTFIEENVELIEENKWEEVYEKAAVDLQNNTGEFTEVMLSVDIHPEKYLKKLPKMFLAGSFDRSNFTIPDGVTSIGSYAFRGCSSLSSITIKNPRITFADDVFYGCDNLNIQFAGTKDQWKNIAKGNFSKVTYTCNCIDGVLKKSR